jgi:hypothetical protein
MTALGNYSGDRADLVLYRTVGGQLNASTAVENKEIGKLVFRLHSCNHAVLEYEIDSIYSSGQVPIRRIASDNTSWCEELQTDQESAAPLTENDSFKITEGLNGAWFNPDWPGQGIFLNVLPDSRQFFLGWFTWDVERLFNAGNDWNIGDMNQRWLTAQGSYEGNIADLDLSLTRGGVLLSAEPRPVNELYGKAQIRFSNRETAELEYDIPFLGMNGLIPLKRNSNENVEACREMAKRPASLPAVTKQSPW